MTELAALLAIMLMAVCAIDLRKGVYATMLAGFLQDPIRKLTPGQPVYFIGVSVIFLAVTFFGAKLHGVTMVEGPLRACRQAVKKPLYLFLALVGAGVAVTLGRTGNAMIAGIGLMSYFAPLPAILVGYRFGRRDRDIERFLTLYAAAVAVMMSGVFIFFSGREWEILKPVGEWLDVYTVYGGATHLLPGFFRTSEIAAWHGSGAICSLILWSVAKKRRPATNAVVGLTIAYLFAAILLTGRRKALAEAVLFMLIYGALLVRLHRGSMRIVKIAAVSMVVAGLVLQLGIVDTVTSSRANPYLDRGKSVTADIAERLNLTLDSFSFVLERNGIFGSGTGTGSQGAQHFGGGDKLVGGAAESGPAKVLAELGAPGMLVVIWLVIGLSRFLWRAMKAVGKSVRSPQKARMAFGFVAFLGANASVFFTAHQVFGDPLVLIMLGWCLGFVFALLRAEATVVATVRQPQPSHDGVRDAADLPPAGLAVGAAGR